MTSRINKKSAIDGTFFINGSFTSYTDVRLILGTMGPNFYGRPRTPGLFLVPGFWIVDNTRVRKNPKILKSLEDQGGILGYKILPWSPEDWQNIKSFRVNICCFCVFRLWTHLPHHFLTKKQKFQEPTNPNFSSISPHRIDYCYLGLDDSKKKRNCAWGLTTKKAWSSTCHLSRITG